MFGSSRHQPQNTSAKSVEPTTKEMQAALSRLDGLVALAIFGEIGGVKPQKENRAKSWWGGNFLGAEDEDAPICKKSERSIPDYSPEVAKRLSDLW